MDSWFLKSTHVVPWQKYGAHDWWNAVVGAVCVSEAARPTAACAPAGAVLLQAWQKTAQTPGQALEFRSVSVVLSALRVLELVGLSQVCG